MGRRFRAVLHTGFEPRTSRQGPRQVCCSHVCLALHRQLGPSAPSLARRASGNYEISGTYYPLSVTDAIGGVATYRAALRLRAAVADRMQIVQGSVAVHVAGIGVVPCSLRLPILKTHVLTHSLTHYLPLQVACPCLESLQNFAIGAQGAVRRAAGPSFEASLDSLDLPLEPLSTALVEGGALAPALVAMVVTTPPWDAPWLQGLRHGHRAWQTLVSHRLHLNLFAAVRAAGRTSVSVAIVSSK